MKFLLFTFMTFLTCINVYAKQYQCTSSNGQQVIQDLPCNYVLQNEANTSPNEAYSADPDALMRALSTSPYNSNSDLFITYVNQHDLLVKKDNDGDTVLSIAAINGQADVVDYLINQGLNVNDINYQGYTVFSFVTQFTDPIKQSLIRHGADINHVGEGGITPLINAVLSDDLNTVDFLIDYGATIDHLDQQGGSPLYYAASIGNIDMVKRFVEAGADVNIGETRKPLSGSTTRGHFNVNTYLILHGAVQ